jgi:heptosyltransferase III
MGQALGISTGCGMNTAGSAILIFRIGSLGDTVVALPCFHSIARSFPDARRIVVTDSPVSQKVAPVDSVLGNSGLIHDVIYFPPPPRQPLDFFRLRRRIRQTNAATLIYVADRNLASTLRDIWFFRWCGIRHIIGAPLARDLRRLRINPATGDTEHEAERLARCLSPLGPIDLEDSAMWDLQLVPEELRLANDALAGLEGRDFVAISVGGKDRAKDWGNDNWSTLLRMMAIHYSDMSLVFIGSGDEFSRTDRIAAEWPGVTLNLCGRFGPRVSAAVMMRAALYLGHDCGPMHLAAAVDTPCLAMFGAFNRPKEWHPMGRGHRIIHNLRGVREITPLQVLEAVDAAMENLFGRITNRNAQTRLAGGQIN